MSAGVYVSVRFTAEIKLSPAEIAEAEGDLRRAVQSELAHTGAVVYETEGDA